MKSCLFVHHKLHNSDVKQKSIRYRYNMIGLVTVDIPFIWK